MHPLVKDTLPEFASELRQLLTDAKRGDLAAKVDTLPFFQTCGCGDDFCSSFYTAPKPDGAYGAGHWNLTLAPQSGTIILDLVGQEIRFVEVLDRPDVQRELSATTR